MPVDDGFNRDEQGRIIAAPMTAKFLIDYLRRQGCSIVTHEELAEERREIEEEEEAAGAVLDNYLAAQGCRITTSEQLADERRHAFAEAAKAYQERAK